MNMIPVVPPSPEGQLGSTPAEPPRRRRVVLWVLVPVAGLLAWGGWGHWQRNAEATQTQIRTEDFVPTVRVATARRDDEPINLTLPGQTQAFDSAAIYARATGYIAERKVDIGSRVHKGDLLVRISAPDLDAQLAQGKAQLGQLEAMLLQASAQVRQSQANTKLADVTNKRTSTLADDGWQPQQQADTTNANLLSQKAGLTSSEAGVRVAQANIDAQRATVNRLEELAGYEYVTAPFDGVVIARSVDVGDLVSADASGGTPMFELQSDDVLRISVQVPQSGAIGIREGLAAEVIIPEMPDHRVAGRVARSAVALNSASRTMLTEVDVPNADHALRAGLFVNVVFAVPRQSPAIVVPDEALLFTGEGEQVATVETDGTVKLRKVTIYRDFGTSAELREGLTGGEQLILSPPATLNDGSKVKVASDQRTQRP